MKDEGAFLTALREVAQHPLAIGAAAGVVRYLVGDRQASTKALATSVFLSVVLAAVFWLCLDGESLSIGKKLTAVFIGGFLARDLLVALLSIGASLKADPWGYLERVISALKGSPKQ